MFKALDSVVVRGTSDSDDQFVICPSAHELGDVYTCQRRTRHIGAAGSLSLVTGDFNLEESLAHVDVHSRTHEIVSSHSRNELSQRLDERSRLDGPDTCRGKERGEGKVGLRRDQCDIVRLGRESLQDSHSLMSARLSSQQCKGNLRHHRSTQVPHAAPGVQHEEKAVSLTPHPPPTMTSLGLSFIARFVSSSSSSRLTSKIGKFFFPPFLGCKLNGLAGTLSECRSE
jgi:hypothetical protein